MAKDRISAVIPGASSGIGLELARCVTADGCDLLLAAGEGNILQIAAQFRNDSHSCEATEAEADLGTEHGLDGLWAIGISTMMKRRMVPVIGLEPTTPSLRMTCSTS